MKKLILIVAKGKQKGMPIPIKADLFLIGSDKVCQLRSHLPGISPQHCALLQRDLKVFVRDWDSGQPTLLNGELVSPGEEVPLHGGDKIGVGPLEFVVQFHEKALSQRDLEEWALKCLDVESEKEQREVDEELSQDFLSAGEAAAAALNKLQDIRGIVKGRVRVSHDSGVTIIRFNDVALVEESEIALLHKEIHDNIQSSDQRVLLDFKNVARMSSVAVQMIMELYRWMRYRGMRLAVCRIRPELQGILGTMNVLETIPYFRDKREAQAGDW